MNFKPDYKYIPPISFSFLTPLYDLSCSLSGLGHRFRRKVLGSVQLQGGMVVADVGCGTGVFLDVASARYPEVKFIGLDPDDRALAMAARRLKGRARVELTKAFAESLLIADQVVDVCFSTLAFHHMPNASKKAAIKEIYRILKKDGKVVIADFGKTQSRMFRKALFFEKIEYLEGNLNGLVSQYLKEAGFRNVVVHDRHFPRIDIIVAEK